MLILFFNSKTFHSLEFSNFAERRMHLRCALHVCVCVFYAVSMQLTHAIRRTIITTVSTRIV